MPFRESDIDGSLILNALVPKIILTLSVFTVMTGCNYSGGDTHASNGSDAIALEEVEAKEEPSLAIEFPPFFDMSRKEIIAELGGDQSVKGHDASNKAGEIIRLEDLPYKGCRISIDFYNRKSDWKPRNLRIWFPSEMRQRASPRPPDISGRFVEIVSAITRDSTLLMREGASTKGPSAKKVPSRSSSSRKVST